MALAVRGQARKSGASGGADGTGGTSGAGGSEWRGRRQWNDRHGWRGGEAGGCVTDAAPIGEAGPSPPRKTTRTRSVHAEPPRFACSSTWSEAAGRRQLLRNPSGLSLRSSTGSVASSPASAIHSATERARSRRRRAADVARETLLAVLAFLAFARRCSGRAVPGFVPRGTDGRPASGPLELSARAPFACHIAAAIGAPLDGPVLVASAAIPPQADTVVRSGGQSKVIRSRAVPPRRRCCLDEPGSPHHQCRGCRSTPAAARTGWRSKRLDSNLGLESRGAALRSAHSRRRAGGHAGGNRSHLGAAATLTRSCLP